MFSIVMTGLALFGPLISYVLDDAILQQLTLFALYFMVCIVESRPKLHGSTSAQSKAEP